MVMPLPVSLQNLPFVSRSNQINAEPRKDWNSIIKHQTELKNDHAILSLYTQMESLGMVPDKTTLPLVLKACGRLNAVEEGKIIHSSIKTTNLVDNVPVGTALVDFYSKCGFLEDARMVFDEMRNRDLVCWNAMIYGYASHGDCEEVILLVKKMQMEGFRPNSRTAVAMLLVCGEVAEVRLGKVIHGYCLRTGLFGLDPHVGTALVGFYVGFDVGVSRLVFDMMAARNTVSWNSMITGYFEVGDSWNALKIFMKMLMEGAKCNSVTMLVVIQACRKIGSLGLGNQIHQMAIKLNFIGNMFIVNALVNMYSEIGSLESSCQLFDAIHTSDIALWNSMLSAFIACGCYEEATNLFTKMLDEGISKDERTIAIMLCLCAKTDDGLRKGKSFHSYANKNRMTMDINLGNAFLNMYAEQNCIESARKIFGEMSTVDVISYNTLIAALVRNNFRTEAWELFELMRESEIEPNSYTIISILAACQHETCLHFGRSLHGFVIKQGIEMNLSLNTALTEMYINCGEEAAACYLFESCRNRDLISWNALIASYIKNNLGDRALSLFTRMISEVEPNTATIVSILSSCTLLAQMLQGQCLHAYVIRRESYFGFDLSLANAFITMYARCGSMHYAEKFFKTSPRRDIISWNAMITGYGLQGHGRDAICAFSQMLEDDFQPNSVTFLSVISACSHSGLVEEGLKLFHSMVQEFSINPQLAHYGCVVDLLGRAGCLDEAKDFIKSMPIKPDASVWRALLSACRDHCDPKEAERIFEKIVELEPMNPGNYVLLRNIYAEAGLWSEVRQIRMWLKEKGLRKSPGISWIVVCSQIHCFTAGDRSHPLTDKIYANLGYLLFSIKENGYIPDLRTAVEG